MKYGTDLVVGLFVAALMAAFLLPVAVDPIQGPEEVEITQSTGETTNLQGDLNVTLDSVTDGTSATYTVSTDASSVTQTVNIGANETVTVDGSDVNIALQSTTTSSATSTIEYPTTHGWGDGAGAIWTILPIMMVLAVFLFFVGIALKSR